MDLTTRSISSDDILTFISQVCLATGAVIWIFALAILCIGSIIQLKDGRFQNARRKELQDLQTRTAASNQDAVWLSWHKAEDEHHDGLSEYDYLIAIWCQGRGFRICLPRYMVSSLEVLEIAEFRDAEAWDEGARNWQCLGWNKGGIDTVQGVVEEKLREWDETLARDWKSWVDGFTAGLVCERCEPGWELLRRTGVV